jgi:hypothetical protein
MKDFKPIDCNSSQIITVFVYNFPHFPATPRCSFETATNYLKLRLCAFGAPINDSDLNTLLTDGIVMLNDTVLQVCDFNHKDTFKLKDYPDSTFSIGHIHVGPTDFVLTLHENNDKILPENLTIILKELELFIKEYNNDAITRHTNNSTSNSLQEPWSCGPHNPNCRIIENHALGKKFKVCQVHKKEVL